MNKKIILSAVLSLYLIFTLIACFVYFKNKPSKKEEKQETTIIEEQQTEVDQTDEEEYESPPSSYPKLSDSNLESAIADTKTLIKLDGQLYGLALENELIEGDLRIIFGQIKYLTESTNVPVRSWETNSQKFFNAIVVRINFDEIIIQQDEELYRFLRIAN